MNDIENTQADRVAEAAVEYGPAASETDTQPARKKYKKVDASKALRMRLKGMSYREIGAALKNHPGSVQRAIAPLIQAVPGSEALQEYKANRADFLAAKQLQVLNAVTTDKIEKANLQQLTTSFAILYDKERLENGQSTGNQAIHVLLSGSLGASAIHIDNLNGAIDAEIVTE